ncbi:hypothetical protein ES288_D03G018000v1 [Gossypium darwinii]|uniref:Protein kinase domain-containing protein n=1 Tax=Gossypium darwinii TaxID=34276 RepID=A0A5D2D4P8_GOSDA|nr:hypothetical protein ES288_D03G018000v1 [Gossypium darwinii]
MGSLWTIAVVILVNIHLAMDIRRWVFITHAAVWDNLPYLTYCKDFFLRIYGEILQGKKKEGNAVRYVMRSQAIKILQQICHRDLKLENTFLDGSPAPCLKICDFGYCLGIIIYSPS